MSMYAVCIVDPAQMGECDVWLNGVWYDSHANAVAAAQDALADIMHDEPEARTCLYVDVDGSSAWSVRVGGALATDYPQYAIIRRLRQSATNRAPRDA